jgi:hypothetical protein
MQADIDAINRGEAKRGGRRWTVHGRTYEVDDFGHSWPVAGPGVYALDRGAFLALGIYNEFGVTEAAERLLNREGVAEEARTRARHVWRAGRKAT